MTPDPSPTLADTPADTPVDDPQALQAHKVSADEFDELDTLLDELRTRYDETPSWEFCEGFMVALLCARQPIAVEEYLDVLLGVGEAEHCEGSFADAAQRARFMQLWHKRWDEISQALDSDIQSLNDEAAYQPEVTDLRSGLVTLTDEQRAEVANDYLPAFGQVWGLGFMYAVEAWPDDWKTPTRNKELAQWFDACMQTMVKLTEDDNSEPEMSLMGGDEPPTMSEARFEAFLDALWALYDLRKGWHHLGPRTQPVHKQATPSRNDPCFCGSGKKYKKCHGA